MVVLGVLVVAIGSLGLLDGGVAIAEEPNAELGLADPVALGVPSFPSGEDRHRYLWATSERYRRALTPRRIGLAATIGSAAIGAAMVLVAAVVALGSVFSDGGADGTVGLAIAGGALAGSSLVVWLPVTIGAHLSVRRIRSRFSVRAHANTRPAATGAGWRF